MGYEDVRNKIDSIKRGIKRFLYSSRKITCPNCYHKFSPHEVHFRCQNSNCEKEIDEKIDTTALYPHAFPVNPKRWYKRIFIPLKEKCHGAIRTPQGNKPGCGEESRARLCPFCHSVLFLDAGLVKALIIAVVGGPGSSKSHYIVELYDRIREISNFGIIPQINIGQKESDFIKAYFTVHPERGERKILPATLEPIRYHFVLSFNNLRLILAFYDNPGENWEPAKLEGKISERSRYIANADGIILLIDLLQLDNCRVLVEYLAKDLPARRTWSQSNVVETMYLEARKLIHTDKIHKPVAVCLTKIDELETDFSDDRGLYEWISRETVRLNPYDARDQEILSEKIEQRLNRWANNFEPIIKSRFSKTSYFALAPIGCRPTSDGKIENYNPIRVEDPFIWILHQLGLLRREDSSEGI